MRHIMLATALTLYLWTPAAAALEVPPLRAHVTDLSGILSQEARATLEQQLQQHETRTGQQFAVLVVPTLAGDPVEDYSMRVVEAWKLGRAKKDDGLLLLIVAQDPRRNLPPERKLRIEVGYGLEGQIPDIIAGRVIRDVLRPAFRRGDFDGGVSQAMQALMQAGSGEAPTALPPPKPMDRGESPSWVGLFVAFWIICPILLFMLRGGGRGGRGGFGGGFGGFGGGFGGGGGGGGFSGGGGSFGGGGASGDW